MHITNTEYLVRKIYSYLEKIRHPVIESALGEIHLVCMAINE